VVKARRLWSRYLPLAACVVVGLLAAGVVLAHRYALERSYRTVEITVDADDWTALARRTGRDQNALYGEMRHLGVRSVTVYAATLRRLADQGRVTVMTGADVLDAARIEPVVGVAGRLVQTGSVGPENTYVLGPVPALREIGTALAVHLGASRVKLLEGSEPALEIQGRGQEIEDASLGLLAGDLDGLRAQRLAVEFRTRNFRQIAPDGLHAFFARLGGFGERFALIFDGPQVLGFDTLIPQVAAEMQHAGFAYGRIESFTVRRRQRGDVELARAMMPDVIRVFSLTPEELAGLTPDQARDKYLLAARERNVRILYVRPFLSTSAGVDEVQANLDYIGSIARELLRDGYQMGKAAPLPESTVRLPALEFLLMALGSLAATAIAIGVVAGAFGRPIPLGSLYGGVGLGIAVTAVLLARHHVTLWSQILAFLAALAFPTLSMMWFVPGAGAAREDSPDGRAAVGGGRGQGLMAASIARLWALSAVTALGGVMVAALLSQWLFMMEIRAFLGVKLAHIIPVVLIGLLLVAHDAPPGGVWPRLRAWLRQPLLLEYGIAVIVIGVAVVFALGRTGNLGLPALGGLELKTRAFLSHVMTARPRTKEYLVGHPFMILAFALAALGARRWVLPAAVIGAVGQVGLVNSFSHIHTPLVYIFLRTLYALVLGSIIGAVAVEFLLWSQRWWPDRIARVPRRDRTPAGQSPHGGERLTSPETMPMP